jgi:hypothetical protein
MFDEAGTNRLGVEQISRQTIGSGRRREGQLLLSCPGPICGTVDRSFCCEPGGVPLEAGGAGVTGDGSGATAGGLAPGLLGAVPPEVWAVATSAVLARMVSAAIASLVKRTMKRLLRSGSAHSVPHWHTEVQAPARDRCDLA